jgi:hypothetical protein
MVTRKTRRRNPRHTRDSHGNGAGILSWRDLGGRVFVEPTYETALEGFPRREVWLGFSLIVLGTILQLAALV